MLSSLLRSFPRRLGRTWKPLDFSNPSYARIPVTQKIEEETMPGYVASRYYPARIGEVIKSQYQIVGKLGFGASSTVWLARDLDYRRYVTLKIFITSTSMGQQLDDELQMYQRIEKGSTSHPGRSAVRSLLDSFDIDGVSLQDKHRCLVHPPLWESVLAFLHRNPVRRLPPPVLAFILKRLFLALDYLHTECQIIHADIKVDNIIFGIADDSVFDDFIENELQTPCPRKEVDGRVIYISQDLRKPREWGALVLCDFGSAMPGGIEHLEDIQPNIYRAPEVILEVPWTCSVDIWNVGCMIWNIFEGESLFTGHDPGYQAYRSRAHLAEIIRLLGPPPPSLLGRGKLSHKFFSNEGDFCAKSLIGKPVPLEQRSTTLEGEDKAGFLRLVRKMLQWEPAKRSSAKELQQDEWIRKTLGE
ncbi:kinase-like protein [Aspergillus ibericus CBS 121593]|uniref:Kinase-like protein n=1 Tax=Aspergillus ibericus CBS 121593 TaxID=1448316 RepID=A0A395HAD9_9EURO|nr:kinase-like protein [Aspergillus ibericus CBS 121593]RAL04616.1 kinase-like protein [Aspergillus ibericus CBS 121593]